MYIDGLIDIKSLDEHVAQPLVTSYREPEYKGGAAGRIVPVQCPHKPTRP